MCVCIQGMLCARGERCLMVDADGATKFADLVKLEDAIKDKELAIAVGSRSHLVSTDAVVKVRMKNMGAYGNKGSFIVSFFFSVLLFAIS